MIIQHRNFVRAKYSDRQYSAQHYSSGCLGDIAIRKVNLHRDRSVRAFVVKVCEMSTPYNPTTNQGLMYRVVDKMEQCDRIRFLLRSFELNQLEILGYVQLASCNEYCIFSKVRAWRLLVANVDRALERATLLL